MAKEKKAFALRLDPELHRAIEQWAGDEFRSVNAHIEFLLREAARKAGRLKQLYPPPQEDSE
ncbi:toxin-antitoxin system HicB family antitoxin [Paenibacillus sp. SYP-B4298]|uniref:toxin-antitoxin system HicB family antitoxin n=1 Tax=Paenibacillus sp. SYP-B4298 TaxID=2996034 RepID=UPI0022DD2477|nr:toxin-antitoxin system HicB family antitoxin [Paenibacillus sp. SYP-B4298]